MKRRKVTKAATLKALQGSIRKWERIVDGSGPDQGDRNCPLCQMFLNNGTSDDCLGCPVRKATGEAHCTNTPYVEQWAKARELPDLGDWAMTAEQIVAARAELDFLRSLLPKKLQIVRE